MASKPDLPTASTLKFNESIRNSIISGVFALLPAIINALLPSKSVTFVSAPKSASIFIIFGFGLAVAHKKGVKPNSSFSLTSYSPDLSKYKITSSEGFCSQAMCKALL